MVGQLVKTIYKYEKVGLDSGAVITADAVYIANGKVNQVNSGVAKVGDRVFVFSISHRYEGENTTQNIYYNLNDVPQNIDGQAIVNEFISFVEADIV